MHMCTGKERPPLFGSSLESNHLDDLQYRNLNSTLLPTSEVDLYGGTIKMYFGVKKKNWSYDHEGYQYFRILDWTLSEKKSKIMEFTVKGKIVWAAVEVHVLQTDSRVFHQVGRAPRNLEGKVGRNN